MAVVDALSLYTNTWVNFTNLSGIHVLLNVDSHYSNVTSQTMKERSMKCLSTLSGVVKEIIKRRL